MNISGFNALCFENNGYAMIPWKGIEGNQFSICVKCLTDSWNEQGTIFSLGSLFSVEAFNGHISFKSDNIEEISEEKIPIRCQNTITVVYDGIKILLYCNSFCFLEIKISLDSCNAKFLKIGEGLTYTVVFKTAIFSKCLDFNEVRSAIAGKPTDPYCQIDFTTPVKDPEIILNNSRIENFVYTLDCSEGKLTVPKTVFPDNFTLLLSFFALKNDFCGGILFKTPNICVELCDFSGIGTLLLKITYFNKKGNSSLVIKNNCWTDLAIIFNNGEIQVFFNNDVQLRFNCDISSEKGEIEFGKFSGYINSCYIAKNVLSAEQIQGFFKNLPSDFDKNFLRLFNFAEELLWENNEKFIFEGAKLVLVKGTGAGTAKEANRTLPDVKKNYSSFAKWQIKVLICLLVDWVYQLLGVYPNSGVHKKADGDLEIDERLYEFVYREIASMKEAQILLSHYDSLESGELYALICAMQKNGTLKKLLDYLYQKDDEQDSITDILLAILAVAALAAILSSVGNAITDAGVLPKPPKYNSDINNDDDDDDDDDDDKKKKTYLSIKQTFLKSELKIESDTKDIDNKNISGILVKNDSKKVFLDVELSYKGDDDEFTVYAENKQGGTILSAEKTVYLSGKKTVKITLDVQRDKFKRKYGKCTEELRWRCESADGEQVRFLGETSVDIYFLENTPCEPWDKSINIECLKLCAKCSDDAGDNSKGFVEDYAAFLKKRNQPLTAGIQSVYKKAYSKAPDLLKRNAIFDSISFSKDLLGRNQISMTDLTHSHVIFSRLNGYKNIKSVLISPVFSNSGKLLLKDNKLIDSHYAVEDSEGRIYDHELKSFGLKFSKDQKYLLTGDTNSEYYRESNYLPDSYCMITYAINKWELGCLPDENYRLNSLEQKEPPVGWVIRKNNRVYEHSERTATDWSVFNYIKNKYRDDYLGNAVCHSISSKYIDDAIAGIFNSGNYNFEPLLKALYPNDIINYDDVVIRYYNSSLRMANTLARVLNTDNEFLQQLILHFCFLASNSPANLRIGNSSWNGTIGKEFDPTSWFYYYGEGTYISSERGYSCEPFDNNKMHEYYGNVPDPLYSGFYLPNREDGIRIKKMRELNLPVILVLKCVLELYDYENPREYPFMYSSSNRFIYRENNEKYVDLYTASRNIYFLYNNEWVPIDHNLEI